MMWPRVLVALLVLGSIPTGQAQTSAPTPIMLDGLGDVSVGGLVPSDVLPASDLAALDYTSSDTVIWLSLRVANLEAANRPAGDSVTYDINMKVEGAGYTVRIERVVPLPVLSNEISYDAAFLLRNEELDTYRLVTELNLTFDAIAMKVDVPIRELRSVTGVPVRPGSVLEEVFVTSRHWIQASMPGPPSVGVPTPPAPEVAYDRMPDTGAVNVPLVFPVVAGREVLFQAPDPVRASNGGPGTFVFPIRLTNLVDQPQDRVLELAGLPDGWSHAFVEEAVHLEGLESHTTHVVINAAGGHTHGGAVNFTVRTSTPEGSNKDAVQLSILYTDIPQPAGHHPTLYFHTLAGDDATYDALEPALGYSSRRPFMNTLEEDEQDTGLPANADGDQWNILLSPRLGIGLDFEVSRTGIVRASFATTSEQAFDQFTVDGSLILRAPAGDVELARVEASTPIRLTSTAAELELAVHPSPESDLVPYAPDQQLILVLTAHYTPPTGDFGRTVANLVDGQMTLPLLEYQDVVPPGTTGDIQATATPDRQYANPGETVAFEVTVRNLATRRLDLTVTVLGNLVEAQPDANTLQLGIGQDGRFLTYVTVPSTAIDGDQFGVFLKIADTDSATLVGSTVVVTTTEDVDNVQAPARKESPPPSFYWVVAALALAGLVNRFRR